MKSHRIALSLFALSVTILACAQPVRAADYFLTIGGGYAPTGNQISLEKNVQLFQKMLYENYPNGTRHDIFFSDGANPDRDLQFADAGLQVPRANRLLAQVMRQTKYLDFRYRTHEVSDVRGATTRSNISKWFDEVGSKLKTGDRLFIYATAHGGRSVDKKNSKNTGLYLWNRQKLLMTEWTAHLDKIPSEVPVVSVMVQCYSGGFASAIFNQGDAKKGATASNRCGFYATVYNRMAAGCTADINEDDYREYSTSFWEAIRGKTRRGGAIERPDYDGDGLVSYNEAHAYVLLTSSTIDIPVRTSDAFLRHFSKLAYPKPKTKAKPASARTVSTKRTPKASVATTVPPPPLPRNAKSSRPVLLTADTPLKKLVQLASPADRAVLDGLSTQLRLSQPQRAKAARAYATKIMKDKQKFEIGRRKKTTEYTKLSGQIRTTLLNRWPELANRWHPVTNDVLQNHSEELVRLIESHPRFKKFDELRKQLQKLSAEAMGYDRQWVKCQRLIRALEHVALAANLSAFASPEIQQRFARLVSSEAGVFGVPTALAAEQNEESP